MAADSRGPTNGGGAGGGGARGGDREPTSHGDSDNLGARVMERSHEAMAGRHLTKAELEEQGSPVELVDQRWRRGS